jgi:hypothetical protein
MLVGVEIECHVELFAFIDAFLARGKRYSNGIVAVGAMNTDGNVARDGLFLPFKFD